MKIMTGLKTLSSKLPCEPAKPMAASLPMTCTATIVMASACVGFTLPGMIDEPGSFSGSVSSPRPQRGPEASQRMSLAIFISEAASVFERAAGEDELVVGGERGEFVGMRAERQAGQLGDLAGGALGEFGMGVEPGADGGAADGQIVEAVEGHWRCACRRGRAD